jgi:methylmalonyl-CoA/ethylmalonyl-CoA epimerase
MIRGLDHIAIAVQDLNTAIELWCGAFQVPVSHREIVKDQQVEIALIKLGSLRIELVSPISPDSPIAKFIAKRGEGLHHFAVEADSTKLELERLNKAGISLIDAVARSGAEGTNIGFLHPRALGGVLVEIVDHSGK